MVTDYEAAWSELQQYIAGKTQHGRDGLLLEMAQIQTRHRVAAGELPRVLRLYGVETERLRRAAETHNPPDSAESLTPGLASVADLDRPDHHDERGHDGRHREAGRAN